LDPQLAGVAHVAGSGLKPQSTPARQPEFPKTRHAIRRCMFQTQVALIFPSDLLVNCAYLALHGLPPT
ncbi:hypothetical protein HAX54_042392, partial [Datura stramonium]|nr:hypothetical protein [Datura stramonium]